jgi:hypothetical protein
VEIREWRRLRFQRHRQEDGQTWKSERVVRPLMPGNAGGGKGPYFRCAFEEGEER